MLQVGCCGADGANDYLSLQQPLPTQCRDTVTGNPFYHGCVDELTWFFEEKTAWVVGLAMSVCFAHVSIRYLITLRKKPSKLSSYNKAIFQARCHCDKGNVKISPSVPRLIRTDKKHAMTLPEQIYLSFR